MTPAGAELVSRQQSVLRVLYPLFNHGYAHQGSIDVQRQRLMERATRLGRLLVRIFVDSAVAKSLLALMPSPSFARVIRPQRSRDWKTCVGTAV